MLIGLTGGIGSGKSLATDMLSDMGCVVIDTDIIAHELSKPGGKLYNNIVSEFGREYLDKNGEINRDLLAEKVFSDSASRHKLNEISHSLILRTAFDEYKQILEEDGDIAVIVVVPLLFEGGESLRAQLPYDYSLLITADTEIRIDRLMKTRSIGYENALRRISSQMPEVKKIGFSDYTIENNGTKEELKGKLIEFMEKFDIKYFS